MAHSDAATRALQAQFAELLKDPPPGINAGPVDPDEDLLEWTACIQGPAGTPYEGGLFFLSLQFPETYPYDPPRVKFTTPIYHCNVTEGGDICLSILFKDCCWDRGWTPALSVSAVLLSVQCLMCEPNTDHSLRPELARQYDSDRAAFEREARAHTRQHAM